LISPSRIVDPLGLAPRAAGLGRRAASRAGDATADAAVDALERAVASPRSAHALRLLLGSALVEETVRWALEGPLVEATVRAAVEQRVAERVVAELQDTGALDRALEGPLVENVVRAAIGQHVAERVAAELLDTGAIDRALEGPRVAQLAARVLESEGTERLVEQVLDSHLLDTSVARVLAGDQLWVVVDEIAESPAVTQAIAQQSVGLADQVAGEVSARSRRADDRLEGVARRLLHRPARRSGARAPSDEPGLS
jgi:citrate lyase gamma subunit